MNENRCEVIVNGKDNDHQLLNSKTHNPAQSGAVQGDVIYGDFYPVDSGQPSHTDEQYQYGAGQNP